VDSGSDREAGSWLMDALSKVRALEFKARNTSSAEVGSALQTPRLPDWSETHRAIPNVLLRSAAFAVIGKGQRAWLDGATISSQAGDELTYTGQQLDQTDLDLCAAQLHLMRNHPLNQGYQTSLYALLNCLEITDTGPNRASLKMRLQRLSNCEVSIRAASYMYEGGLVHAERLEGSNPLVLHLNPEIIRLFAKGQLTWVHWGIRRSLSGCSLAQWLHGFYSTHAAPFPVRVETLRRLSGSKTANMSKFIQLLQRALDRLKQVSTAHDEKFEFQIENGLVKISKSVSASQRRYLAKRQNSTVAAGK